MRTPSLNTALRKLLKLLHPTAYNKYFAKLINVRRNSVRWYIASDRTPPLAQLELLQSTAMQRSRDLLELAGPSSELGEEIKRLREKAAHKPIHRGKPGKLPL